MHQMLAVQVRVQLQVQVPALEGEVAAAQVVAVQEWALGSSLAVASAAKVLPPSEGEQAVRIL